ncbi:hypothetical protein LYNGBM3L_70580 [Moorena producens 3L]|uniref:Uncharacterized protein n=1 Tax=Moorena producens 3L TaxID=489825 RepID=F4Y2K7_9CYAN|nr:hypothetical protein LYNGBM3L_70580 [Moorena producens 3L]
MLKYSLATRALHAIEFDRLNYFLAQVVAVRFGHDRNRTISGRAFLFYVLTMMATAIICRRRCFWSQVRETHPHEDEI